MGQSSICCWLHWSAQSRPMPGVGTLTIGLLRRLERIPLPNLEQREYIITPSLSRERNRNALPSIPPLSMSSDSSISSPCRIPKASERKQERIAEYTTAINVIRQLYKQSMQNTKGFGEESRYYQLIGENALYIVTNIPVAVSWLTRKPHINLPLCLNEISNLTMKTEQCIAGFVNISSSLFPDSSTP